MLSVLILCFVSPCLCKTGKVTGTNHTNIYNVMEHGARGDGKSDDTQVCYVFFYSPFNLIFIFYLRL